MSELFSRILLPVASEADAVATARALEAIDYEVGSLQAVHVVEKAGGAVDKASVEQRKETAEAAFDALGRALDRPIETRITYGTDVAEAIFTAADEADATAIVITPRGGSRWIRLLTGDVALSLVTDSDRPVVVLPNTANGAGADDEHSEGAEAVEDE